MTRKSPIWSLIAKLLGGFLVKSPDGSELALDEEASVIWAAVPHFYFNFYLYQYPAAYVASQALAEKVLQGGEMEREAYMSFLRAGQMLDSLEALQMAGVDMTTPQPIEQAIQTLDHLLDRFETLLHFHCTCQDSYSDGRKR